MKIQSQDSFKRHGSEDGATLVVMLVFLVLVSLLGMSLLFTTEVELQSSKGSLDRTRALNDTDNALNEIFWRLNLEPGGAGSLVTVNSLTKYDASIDYDPFDLLTNGVDDDGDGAKDEPDELNLTRDWEIRVGLIPDVPAKVVWGGIDKDPTNGPPWGSKLVLPTVQPSGSWHEYSTADPSSSDALSVRFKLDTDTPLGDSEGDGAEIVFYDLELTKNGVDDANTLTGLGGDSNPANDSPYNITYYDGTTTHPASGVPVLLIRATGRTTNPSGETLTRFGVEAESYLKFKRPVITKAVCGCTAVKVAGGAKTDSYRSSEGDYGVGGIYQNGDVGSNASLMLVGGSVVSGNVEANLDLDTELTKQEAKKGIPPPEIIEDAYSGGAIGSPLTLGGTGYPNENPPPLPCNCTAVNVPQLLADATTTNDNGSILPDGIHPWNMSTGTISVNNIYSSGKILQLSSSESIILTGGTYYFDSITLSADASIQIGVDANMDGIVDGPPTQDVRIFVGGTVNLAGKGLVNLGLPTDVEIYADGAKTDFVSISGSVEFRGMLYAPSMDANVAGGSDFKGAILASDVTVAGGGRVHFDEDLMNQTKKPDAVKLLAWREVP